MKNPLARKITYVTFLLLVIASAIFLYFFSLQIDRRYTVLLNSEIRISRDIYKIVNNRSKNLHKLSNALYTTQADSIKKIEQEWRTNVEKEKAIFGEFSREVFLDSTNKKPLAEITESETELVTLCNTFFDIRYHQSADSARTFWRQNISPSYSRYRDKLESLLETSNNKLQKIGDGLTQEHSRKGLLYLSMGATPLIFFSFYLVFGLGLLIYLSFLIFRRDRS